jgi:PAS domain S-box-containing protein
VNETLPRDPQLLDVLKTLDVHDHVCLIYETQEQLLASAIPFFLIGLDRGEKCLYVADKRTISAFLDGVRAEGVDVDVIAERGLLTVANEQRTYLKKGYFNPEEMIRYWAGNVQKAKAAGFPALRFAGETSWALGGDPGTERLIEYEARINRFLIDNDAVCICQYNSKRFTPEVILQVLRTHPLVIYGGRVCKNPYYVPPDEFLKPNQKELEVQRWLDNIEKYEKLERALRTARDEWEQSFNAISDFVCVLNPTGAILRANKSMRDRFEPILGNLVGLDFRRVYWGMPQPDPAAPWSSALSGGPPVSLETKLPALNGWYLVSSYPLYDDKHEPRGAVFVVRDITKRKLAEEALRLSDQEQRRAAVQLERERARLVEAQEVANIGSWEVDLQSLDVIWSQQTHRIFETEPSRFRPTRPKFREFVHPEDLAKVDAAFEASLDKRTPCAVEYRIVMPDGRVKLLEERWQTFRGKDGMPARIAGTCRDITERAQAKEELQRLSGKLLRLQDDERRRIARELHDTTGQNLVALATMLDGLRKSIPSVERKSRKILSSCEALADQCIHEIRTLSYLLYPAMLDQAGLEDAIRDYVDGFAKRSGIRVELDFSPRMGRMARDVELALFRVVQESLTNIQRHSGSHQARIRIHRDSDLVLEISDPGRELASGVQSEQEKLQFKGGVGIPSMQERVNLIGGQLQIESMSGGTIVRVSVPLGGDEIEKTSNPDR